MRELAGCLRDNDYSNMILLSTSATVKVLENNKDNIPNKSIVTLHFYSIPGLVIRLTGRSNTGDILEIKNSVSSIRGSLPDNNDCNVVELIQYVDNN